MKIAYLGLGVMGAPMGGHLTQAGFSVAAWNRSAPRAKAFTARYHQPTAQTLNEAIAGADVVILCVGADPDVDALVAAALAQCAPQAVFIDHTTTSAALAKAMAERCAQAGCSFLDAPVSGGQAGAEAGRLTTMVGGEAAALERVRPVLGAYCASITHIGGPGAGQLAKMVNQICIAGVVQGLAEGLHFAAKAGLDPALVIQAISRGAAQSWQMENRWKTMVEGRFDFGFAVDWMRKDLGLVLEEAGRNGATLALTSLVEAYYAELQGAGAGRLDTSSLIKRLQDHP
jgi:3-hydroxyisobutyrate dehydrogenase